MPTQRPHGLNGSIGCARGTRWAPGAEGGGPGHVTVDPGLEPHAIRQAARRDAGIIRRRRGPCGPGRGGCRFRRVRSLGARSLQPGMQPLGFPSSPALQIDDGLVGVPALRTENACASGSRRRAHEFVPSRGCRADKVLVIGVQKMTGIPGQVVGQALLGADCTGGCPTCRQTTGVAGVRPAA